MTFREGSLTRDCSSDCIPLFARHTRRAPCLGTVSRGCAVANALSAKSCGSHWEFWDACTALPVTQTRRGTSQKMASSATLSHRKVVQAKRCCGLAGLG
jgi:hypothetical protein